jgi:hypothetical protein
LIACCVGGSFAPAADGLTLRRNHQSGAQEIVTVEEPDDNGFNSTAIVSDAVTGVAAFAAAGVGIWGAGYLQSRKSEEDKRERQAKEVDDLVAACQEVVTDLPIFAVQRAETEHIDRLQRHLQTW